MADKNVLFTPDTMHDGYEQALLDGMNNLHITHTTQTRIKATRELIPNLYMRLCYIAIACQKQKNYTTLYDSIIVFTETLENISQLHQINHTPIPRFYIKRTNAHGFIGYIWVDSQHIYNESLIYETEAEALEAIENLQTEIAEFKKQLKKQK